MTQAGSMFEDVAEPWREAFAQAWESWRSGSLGIGAVVVDAAGTVRSTGRNRVLEVPGSGPLAGTLLAHAEMNAFAELGLAAASGLSLYTTMEPCLMCSATAISVRLGTVHFACVDPVYDGLDRAFVAHPFMAERLPARQRLDHALLSAFAAVLPMANRVWSRPGQPPRGEWLQDHRPCWTAAQELVASGLIARLARDDVDVERALLEVAPVLRQHGAA